MKIPIKELASHKREIELELYKLELAYRDAGDRDMQESLRFGVFSIIGAFFKLSNLQTKESLSKKMTEGKALLLAINDALSDPEVQEKGWVDSNIFESCITNDDNEKHPRHSFTEQNPADNPWK